MRSTTPIAAVGRGLLAGAAGTAAMTAAQTVYYAVTSAEPSTTPAEAARRIIRGVLHREVPETWTPALNTVMHWGYGTSWGAVYGVVRGGVRDGGPGRVLAHGLAFGTLVWSTSLVHLPAMGLAKPVWRYTPSQVAPDLGFHLVYGLGTAAGHAVLAR